MRIVLQLELDLHVVSESHALLPGKYLEIFGRKNNLRNFWVTVGNEVCGWNHLADKVAKAEAEAKTENEQTNTEDVKASEPES